MGQLPLSLLWAAGLQACLDGYEHAWALLLGAP